MVRPLLAVVLLASPAFAQTIYRWTDAKGIVHYSDDQNAAPKGVKVETTKGEELNDITVTKSKEEKGSTVATNESMAVPPPPADERDAREFERYWRGEFKRVRSQIKQLEQDIAADEKIVASIGVTRGAYAVPGGNPRWPVNPYLPATAGGYYPYSGYLSARERLDTNRSALVQAKEDLTDLERAAANAAVPLEWRR